MNHWALIRRAVADAERKRGRYLTAREVENVQQEVTSTQLTARERRAMQRIWPGFQLEFNLGDTRGS